ncbi:MAG: flagellar biosynthetic protein FliR [Microthrixaceae bacterium]|nr:flagellar biosynthetic protein FliR [Microthrixaceae bacterium]
MTDGHVAKRVYEVPAAAFGLGSSVCSQVDGDIVKAAVGWRGALFGALFDDREIEVGNVGGSEQRHGVLGDSDGERLVADADDGDRGVPRERLALYDLSKTFELSPASGFRIDRVGTLLVHDIQAFLIAALQVGAPILGALFVTEILLGLASRAAPKLNVMVLGFGAKSLVMFMLLGAALPLIPYVSAQLVKDALEMMHALVRRG